MVTRSADQLVRLLAGFLAASCCYAAASSDTGVTSGQLDVLAAQPKSVTCDAPAPLGQYDSYCEGLRVDYFLLAKQRRAPSLTGLTPNISSFVPNLNGTAAPANFKGINAAAAAKKYSFAVRYSGALYIDQSGMYDFQLNSPAGTRLTVNGNTVTFNEGSNTSTPTTGYKFPKAGYIPIELVFFNENSIPSVSLQWKGPLDNLYTVLEGSSIQFNCSFLQNTTNSVPEASSALCSGLSAVYYSNWKNNSYALATSTADFTLNEPALNHWSTDTTPYWSGLPATLHTKFAARYHGQLWVPLPGKYTFKLAAVQNASLYLGSNNILNNSADGRATLKAPATATFEFASSGYYPLGLNYVTQQSGKPGSLRLTWMGPNSPAYKVVAPFRHPCSTFVACTNTSTNGALPAPVVGMTPSGSTIESSSAMRSPSLATFIPNSNVTFTLTFPFLDASDPNVEDVAYFVREAIANAAGLKLESVWTVPQLDDDGNVVFPVGAYFTSVASAQKFYNLVNLRPQTIFQSSAGLEDFYPIRVSSPTIGTTVRMATAVQPARSTATLASATGEGNNIPLPATPTSPVVLGAPSPNVSSPIPTQTPQPTASPIEQIPQAATPTPTPVETSAAPAPSETSKPTATPTQQATPTPTAAAPAPVEDTPSPTAAASAPVEDTPSPTAAAPAPAEGTPSPTAAASAPVEDTPSPTAAAPVPVEDTPSPTVAAPAPAEGTPSPTAAASAPVEGTPSPTAAVPAPTEGTPSPTEATPAPAPTDSLPTATPTSEAVSPSPAEVPTPTAAAPESNPQPTAVAPETSTPTITDSPTPNPASLSPTPEASAPAPSTPQQTPTPTPGVGTGVTTGLGRTPVPTVTSSAAPYAPATGPVVSANPGQPAAYPITAPAPTPAAGQPGYGPAPTTSPSHPAVNPYSPIASAPAPTTSASMPTTSAAAPSPAVPVPTRTALAPSSTLPPQVIAPASEPTPAPRPYSPFPRSTAAAPAPGMPMPYGTPAPTAYALPMYSPGVASPHMSTPGTPYTTTPATSRATASPVAYGPTTGPNPAPISAQPGSPAPYPGPQTGSTSGPILAPAPGPDSASASNSPRNYQNSGEGEDGFGTFGRPTRTPSPTTAVAPALGSAPTQTPAGVRGGSAYDYKAPAPAPADSGPASTTPQSGSHTHAPGPSATSFDGAPLPSVPSPIALIPTASGPAYYLPGSHQLTPYQPNSGTPAGVYTSPATYSPQPAASPIPSPPATYFVPYPGTPSGFLVPYPPTYTPSQEGPVPYAIPYSSPVIGTGPITLSPSTGPETRPLYYGFSPSSPGGRPIPYAYYGPAASPAPVTPVRPAPIGTLFGPPSPSGVLPFSAPTGAPTGAPASGMALAPGQFFDGAPGPAPMVIGVPAPAPSQAALCACNPADTSARNVKIEVLSTAYNSSATDTIKFNAYLTFSHPVRSLNSSQIRVFTRQTSEDGTKTTVPGVVSLLSPISQNCAFYSVKGYVTESNPFIDNNTDIYLGAGGANLLDACGEPFNVTVAEVTQKHRLEGLLYATGIAYSEDAGVLLDDSTLTLALAFTDAVPQLASNMFTITGPKKVTMTELERVDGSDAYWTFSATVPEDYYGKITVTMNSAGRKYLRSINPAAASPGSLTINRADPLQQGDLISSTSSNHTRG